VDLQGPHPRKVTAMRIKELFAQARMKSREKHAEGEQQKLGNLRAGSSGIMIPTGEVAGSCVRKAHIRQLGLELEDLSEDKLLMFDLGFANEDVIADKLKSVLPEGHTILREEEIPVEWTTTNGTRVTGRPDIVICKTTGADPNKLTRAHNNMLLQPTLGLELKSVHSIWTARDVLFGGKPKLSNVIQAAHYMWQLNVPYKLIYSAYSQLGQGMAGKDDWISKQFPRPGQPFSEYVEYNPKGQIKHIRQFEIVYDLQFSDKGVVQFKLEDDTKWKDTIVTRDGIIRFFEATSQVQSTGVLGPRPSQVDLFGEKAGYSDCSYCPLKDICDRLEKTNYSTWLQEVQNISSSLKKK
jgi:hypothetical protein